MDSKKHRVIYRNKMYWTKKKKKKRHHRHSRREDSGKLFTVIYKRASL